MMKIDSYVKDIAAAATPVNLKADSGQVWANAKDVLIFCPSTNTSDLLIGSKSRQSFTVVKGQSVRLGEINRTGQSGKYDLGEIYVKAGTNGDDVQICLIDPSN
jgi:hypothetical protein